MQVNNNVSISTKAAPAFGAIKYDSAKDTLKEVLTLSELNSFMEIVHKSAYEGIKNVDVILFGDGKKLTARIADNIELKGAKMSEYSPRWFESKWHFILRMVEKMKERNKAVSYLLAKQNFDM